MNIWHKPTESIQERFIIAIIDGKPYPFFGVQYLDEGSYFTNRQDWHDVEKWCYLDDLLSLSDKAERLERALEVAREEYRFIIHSEFDVGDGVAIKRFMEDYDKKIETALKEIDTIKQKGEQMQGGDNLPSQSSIDLS